jgi:hypothetical protein
MEITNASKFCAKQATDLAISSHPGQFRQYPYRAVIPGDQGIGNLNITRQKLGKLYDSSLKPLVWLCKFPTFFLTGRLIWHALSQYKLRVDRVVGLRYNI